MAHDPDSEVATTSLRVSLLCPVSKVSCKRLINISLFQLQLLIIEAKSIVPSTFFSLWSLSLWVCQHSKVQPTLVAVVSENNNSATNAEHTPLLNKVFSSIITKPNEFNHRYACLSLLPVSFSLSSFFHIPN